MRSIVSLALLAVACLPLAANAETLTFTLTGPSTDITFQLTDGVNYTTFPQANELSIAPISMTDGIKSGLGGLAFFYIVSGTGPDLIVTGLNNEIITLNGPSLLQSGIFDPIYNTGTFDLTGHTTTTSNAPYTLMVGDADPTPAVPEPSTLALLSTGIVGLTARFKRHTVSN
jgi:hypothetical protein